MHQPDLLILDEPTSGLDPLLQQEFLDLVGEARADGQTVFMSSHVLSEVQEIADRVGIIRAGGWSTWTRSTTSRRRAGAAGRIHVRRSPVAAQEFAALPGVTDVTVERLDAAACLLEASRRPGKTAARHTWWAWSPRTGPRGAVPGLLPHRGGGHRCLKGCRF